MIQGHLQDQNVDKLLLQNDPSFFKMTAVTKNSIDRISMILVGLIPEPANINKRKNSATHSPANDKQLKEQRLSSTPPMPAEPSESDPNSSITKK